MAREFVALRGDLVELAPEAGEDAEAEHPGQREPFDPAEAERWRAWSFTLANFDVIAAEPNVGSPIQELHDSVSPTR